MSSTPPLPHFNCNKCLTITTISSLVKAVLSPEVFRSCFLFIFILPTDERSYFSLSKNMLSKSCLATSGVDGSPGLKTLYISANA